MLATKLEIRSILGIENLTIEPGAVTVIEGRNGSGKSSILDAARAVLRGGHDPGLLHDGAADGFVRLTLEDGTTLTKRISRERSSLEVSDPERGRLSRAQAFVDSQVDELGIDPLAIMTCPEAKLAGYLAEAMPLKVEPAAFEAILGRPLSEKEQAASALDLIAAERQRFYDERTGVNRLAKEKRATAAQLREAMPPAEEPADDLLALRAEKAGTEALLAEGLASAKEARYKAENESIAVVARAAAQEGAQEEAEVAKIRLEAEHRIDDVRALGRKRSAEREAQLRNATGLLHDNERETAEALRAKCSPRLAELSEAITKEEGRAKQAAQAEKTREFVASSEKAAARAEAEAQALTHAIERLDEMKLSLLERLPIKGLEIRDGKVLVDGHPFQHANRARRIDIALKLAQLRAGPLGLIVIDNAEGIDPESFPEWEKAAAADGLQVLLARATAGDLTVRKVPA